jgi:PhoH-like ATPase
MPAKPAQLLDPSEFAPVTLPKAKVAQGKKPVPALERVALLETGDTNAPATARAGSTTRAKTTEAPASTKARPTPAVSLVQPGASPTRRARKATGPSKLFVLDTNVLMHDPSSLFRFEEHDIYLPMMTLEELDNHKKGMSEVARNARRSAARWTSSWEAPTACSTKGCRWPSSAIAMPRASCSSRRA